MGLIAKNILMPVDDITKKNVSFVWSIKRIVVVYWKNVQGWKVARPVNHDHDIKWENICDVVA